MSRWEDSRDDFEASKENLQMAQENQRIETRACPFCGDEYQQLPHHMRNCEQGP